MSSGVSRSWENACCGFRKLGKVEEPSNWNPGLRRKKARRVPPNGQSHHWYIGWSPKGRNCQATDHGCSVGRRKSLSITTTPWTIGQATRTRDLGVAPKEELDVIKPDVTEMTPEARRCRITGSDIEGPDGIGYAPGCVGCNALSGGRPTQHQSEYCRRHVEEHLRQTLEGRRRLEFAEARIAEAATRARERWNRWAMPERLDQQAQQRAHQDAPELKDETQWTMHSRNISVRRMLSPREICRPVQRKAGSRAMVKINKNNQGKAGQVETQVRTAGHQRHNGKRMVKWE